VLDARHVAAVAVAIVAALPTVAAAQTDFDACIDRLKGRALAAGISPATAERALASVQPLERVVRADRTQPEFVATFADYFARRVTSERIETGRRLLAEHRSELDRLTARYGVPGQYIVALWGLETNYGRVLGDVPVFDSLSTLACDGRRSEYFSAELINALRIVERGDVEPARMTGSWAGAMGQTQFMPAAYLQYAVDGDGDGRVDLWTSTSDALASGMRYLSALDWERGVRWGREVQLPDAFDYSSTGLDNSRSLEEWRTLGIVDVQGRPLPSLDIDAAVLVPSGHTGPAFIVYANFETLMRWNRSEHFALVVGHLADRIAGAGALRRPPVGGDAVTRAQLIAVQERLGALGYDGGPADGIPGSATRAAIRRYQLDTELVPDGHIDADLLESLQIQ
jgi:peptidoglycan lytic transglycosylase B